MLKKFPTHLLTTVLCLSFFAPLSAMSQMQTMAIPAGTVAKFGEAVSQAFVNAFCIDRGSDTPSRGANLSGLSGDVRLTFNDGTSKTLDLQQASTYVEISGTGSYKTVKVTPKVSNLQSLEFLSHSIATQGSHEDARASERIVKESFPEAIPPNSQHAIWYGLLWKTSFEGDGADAVTTIEYRRRIPEHTFTQRLMKLSTTGDAILLALPNQRTILVDTGFANQDIGRIEAQLAGADDIAIITHPDRDHSGNFSQLQELRPFQDVVLSGWVSPTQVAEGVTKNVSVGYKRTRLTRSPMEMYKSNPANAPPLLGGNGEKPPISAKSEHFEDDDPDEPSSLSVATITADPSVKIELLQLSAPKSANDASIAVRVTHNGYSTLYASDITPKVMRAMADRTIAALIDENIVGDVRLKLQLLHSAYPGEEESLAKKYAKEGSDVSTWPEEQVAAYMSDVDAFLDSRKDDPDFHAALEHIIHESEQSSFSIHADTLKWPHHAWVPQTKSDQEAAAEFVEAVDPQRILFSVGPNDLPGQSVEDVKAFLEKTFPDKHFQFYTTRDDGSIVLKSLLDIMLDTYFGSGQHQSVPSKSLQSQILAGANG